MESSTTTIDTQHTRPPHEIRAGIVSHAIVSLGLHLNEHLLPTWGGLTLPGDYFPGGPTVDALAVNIFSGNLDAWLATVTVDRTDIDRSVYPDRDVHLHHARLPDTGVQVVIYTLLPKTTSGTLFVDTDGGGEPTLWLRTEDSGQPVSVLQRYQLAAEHRDEMWDRITTAVVAS